MLAGRDRVQTEAFEAFRGGYPFRAEFCAPAKGWEKGSVEGRCQVTSATSRPAPRRARRLRTAWCRCSRSGSRRRSARPASRRRVTAHLGNGSGWRRS